MEWSYLALSFRQRNGKASPQSVQCRLPAVEARQAQPFAQHLYAEHDLVHVLAQLRKAAIDQALEVLEHGRRGALHDVDVFLRELERSAFEPQAAWAVANHEAKVDMYDVALIVQQNVSVVAVLDLQKIANQRVPAEVMEPASMSQQAQTDGRKHTQREIQQSYAAPA